jgi:hypothetical protein
MRAIAVYPNYPQYQRSHSNLLYLLSVYHFHSSSAQAISLFSPRSIQRFLVLSKLSIKLLWFTILKKLVKTYKLKKGKQFTFVIDTQWRDQNIFMISLITDNHSDTNFLAITIKMRM